MTPFGLVIVAVIVTLFVVALATPAGRVALIGRARGMVLMLVWLALLALLGTMWARRRRSVPPATRDVSCLSAHGPN